uniref:Pseudouridylate synthase RPUSD4, mitochondrial n=1 Tax=Leptobrachium leishanense TaxID=445787 RepID=A0A8C5QFK2_9ANUR
MAAAGREAARTARTLAEKIRAENPNKSTKVRANFKGKRRGGGGGLVSVCSHGVGVGVLPWGGCRSAPMGGCGCAPMGWVSECSHGVGVGVLPWGGCRSAPMGGCGCAPMGWVSECSHGVGVGVLPWGGCRSAPMGWVWVCSHGVGVGVLPWGGCGCAPMGVSECSHGVGVGVLPWGGCRSAPMGWVWVCSHGGGVGVLPWGGCRSAPMGGVSECSHGVGVGVLPWGGCRSAPMGWVWVCSHGVGVGVLPWGGCGCAPMGGVWVCSHGVGVGVLPWGGCRSAPMGGVSECSHGGVWVCSHGGVSECSHGVGVGVLPWGGCRSAPMGWVWVCSHGVGVGVLPWGGCRSAPMGGVSVCSHGGVWVCSHGVGVGVLHGVAVSVSVRLLQVLFRGVTLRGLYARVVRNDPQLVLINKPHGLPVHGGPSVRQSVSSMLPELSEKIFGRGSEVLRLCHRLDKDTTGALILARNSEAAERVHKLLREREARKVYWALCVGTPSPPEGILDIPIVEQETTGPQKHYKMCLSPRFRINREGALKKTSVCRSAKESVTQYRVLAECAGASLLELQPVTGVKHQLRVHLSYGLDCPILGDHKYSHWGRLAPQQPSRSILQALGLSAPQARSLLLHLHAAQITLPAAAGGPPLIMQCPPPKYFMSSLRRLGLPVPSLATTEGPVEE